MLSGVTVARRLSTRSGGPTNPRCHFSLSHRHLPRIWVHTIFVQKRSLTYYTQHLTLCLPFIHATQRADRRLQLLVSRFNPTVSARARRGLPVLRWKPPARGKFPSTTPQATGGTTAYRIARHLFDRTVRPVRLIVLTRSAATTIADLPRNRRPFRPYRSVIEQENSSNASLWGTVTFKNRMRTYPKVFSRWGPQALASSSIVNRIGRDPVPAMPFEEQTVSSGSSNFWLHTRTVISFAIELNAFTLRISTLLFGGNKGTSSVIGQISSPARGVGPTAHSDYICASCTK